MSENFHGSKEECDRVAEASCASSGSVNLGVRQISKHELTRRIATHEVGHAVAAVQLGWSVRLVTMQQAIIAPLPGSRTVISDKAVIAEAGRAAEQLLFGNYRTPAPGSTDDMHTDVSERRAVFLDALELLRPHSKELEAMTELLLEERILTAMDFEELRGNVGER